MLHQKPSEVLRDTIEVKFYSFIMPIDDSLMFEMQPADDILDVM